jgi:hypothetical protein
MNVEFADCTYGGKHFWYVFDNKSQKYLHKDGTWHIKVQDVIDNQDYENWGGLYSSKEDAEKTYKRFTEPQEVLKNFVVSCVVIKPIKIHPDAYNQWIINYLSVMEGSCENEVRSFMMKKILEDYPLEDDWQSHHIIVKELEYES